jgi:UDP:flavonoid glycosyltransferase YjiC (YdhE family)
LNESASARAARVLFMTSNGTGLGHLTRSMAVARRLAPGVEPLFLTLSAAAPVVREQGFLVEYLGSYDTPGAGSHLEWGRRLRARLAGVLADARPAVLVFDGAHPYPAALEAMAAVPGLTKVWSRRPLWRARRGRPILALAAAFDLVLEPGELAADDDAGLTVARRDEAVRVDPIVLCDEFEVLPREEAERALGLEPGRLNVLVALGQGPQVDGAVRRCLARLGGEPGVQVAALESSISSRLDVPDTVQLLRDTYPVSRYYRAFDFAISAAGYNAFHELIRFAVPTLFVPMPRELDDQAARARYADRAGLALACDGPGSERIEARLDEMLDTSLRARLSDRARELGEWNGAVAAARLLSGLAQGSDGLLSGLPGPGPGRAAMWATKSRARASALLRHPAERRRSAAVELVCVALDASEDELRAGLRELLAGGLDPARVLVMTDSPDFGLLRGAGVVLEYLPPREEVAEHLPGLDYDALVRRRLGEALAGRSPRRFEAIGPVRGDLARWIPALPDHA